jgi:transcriptional regulator with XRE-family HTH domain
MKERLKDLRKALGLNQSKFSKKIGIGQGSYSRIETGETVITEQNIRLVCLTFGVNESWLRTGAGDMFINKDLADTPEERELLGIFRRLSEDMKDFFLKMGRELLKKREAKADSEREAGVDPEKRETIQNAPGSATRPPEAPQDDKPAQGTEKGESPGIGPNPKNGETG